MDSRKRKQVASSDSEVHKRPRFDFSNNEDVIGEILSRIPTKSLLRFRWVCKSWKALLSRSWFVEKHLSRAKPVNRVQLLRYNHKGEELDFTTNRKLVPEKKRSRRCSTDIFSLSLGGEPITKTIVGSCNGLLCLQLSRKKGLLLLLWNPCTGETKLLPELTSFSGGYRFSGLGYDFTTKDYKVIVGRNSTSATGSRTTEVAIFALKTGSWRTVEGLEHVSYTLTNKCGRSLNGSLHWLEYTTPDEDPKGEYIESLKIISFHLGEEKLQAVVSLPDTLPQPEEMGACPCIGIGTTRTSLLVYHYDADSALFTIWTKERDGWSQLVEIPDTEELLRNELVDNISILENGEVLICFPGGGSKVVLYDPKDQTCQLVFETKYKRGLPSRVEAITCLETLVSPTVYGDVI